MALQAELIEQDDPRIGQEIVRVTHEDGRVEELHLHDYDRLYSLPGVYEQIVQERLQCASPARLAAMLGAAVDGAGWPREHVRVLDVAAGNGVSGEALAAEGLHPVLGTDIVPSARAAALRDRPGLYDAYLTLDLLALTDEQAGQVRDLHANALACVAPVGGDTSQVPPPVLFEAARLLGDDALVTYMHDPHFDVEDVVTVQRWRDALGVMAEELSRERYLHRRTVNGEAFEMVGVVWRIRR